MMRARALTLVELVVTISVMMILTAVSVSGLVGMRTWRAGAAVRRVHADLAYARARAMLSSRRTICEFDLKAQSYELQQEAKPVTGKISGSVLAHPLKDEDWRVTLAELGGGLTVSAISGASGDEVGFSPQGLPVNRSGKVITKDVQVRFSNGAQIVIHGGSGLCEVSWP